MQEKDLITNNPIAVIIPAYKGKYLSMTLESLVSQTIKNFIVYVGDDASPDDIKSICDNYKDSLNIKYKRFETNLGGSFLVQQWKRCINLSDKEKWIWLFSDDDIADSNCIESFYKLLEKLGNDNLVEVYRFNTKVIDDNDRFISKAENSPFLDTSLNMAYNILHGKRGNSMPDHIFSRYLYEKYGLVETEFAQAADWGTSIQFAFDNGIYTIPNAFVYWRLGSLNISGCVNSYPQKKIRGHLQFLIWVLDFFKMNIVLNDKIKYIDIQYATEANLSLVIRNHYKKLCFRNFLDIYKFYKKRESNYIRALMKTFRLFFCFRNILSV